MRTQNVSLRTELGKVPYIFHVIMKSELDLGFQSRLPEKFCIGNYFSSRELGNAW